MPASLSFAWRYFALVFGTGFVLGTVRVLWLVPHLGERWAELLEMPLMGLAIWCWARWLWGVPASSNRAGAGAAPSGRLPGAGC